MSQFPCLPPPRPPIARQHCRFYGYEPGLGSNSGPTCEAGVDNRQPGGSKPCWPDPTVACSKRKEWTDAERAAAEEWGVKHMARMRVVMAAIPRDGYEGQLSCPGCGVGTVRWYRARSNNHLHAKCSTPMCFQVMQ